MQQFSSTASHVEYLPLDKFQLPQWANLDIVATNPCWSLHVNRALQDLGIQHVLVPSIPPPPGLIRPSSCPVSALFCPLLSCLTQFLPSLCLLHRLTSAGRRPSLCWCTWEDFSLPISVVASCTATKSFKAPLQQPVQALNRIVL